METSRFGRGVAYLGAASVLVACLGGCTGSMPSLGGFGSSPQPVEQAAPAVEPEIPGTIRPDEIVGRWGLASFHKPDDRLRTENAARGQCKQPYVINPGTSGGIIMHLADEATPQELRIKGSRSGKNYIGPPGPAGGEKDREIVSFDGRVLITRFLDKDANGRYGTMVYVRCAPRA
ncbi:hypothetical protein [Bradyrhizobium prioriisuperbiae]|uniref:hypothetical protein n=1 Tax=Bradyrhizobium prioriisuperbiae TaxID=2854389 RepID=UPI0038991D0E